MLLSCWADDASRCAYGTPDLLIIVDHNQAEIAQTQHLSAMMTSGLLSPVPLGDALAVKEGLSLESAVATLRKLDGRDKATKVKHPLQ